MRQRESCLSFGCCHGDTVCARFCIHIIMMSHGTLWWNNVTDVVESRRRELGRLTDLNQLQTGVMECDVDHITSSAQESQFLMQFFIV